MKTQNKRILHAITLSSVGGAQSVVVNLANAQCECNDVYILSSSSCEAWKSLDPRAHIIVVKELRREISLRDIVVLAKMFYWRIKIKPDIIQLHSSKMGMFGRIIFPKNKTIYTVHGFDSMRVANRKFLLIEKILKNQCQYIVGVSGYDVNNLRAEGISKNVKLIYNGVRDYSSNSISGHLEKYLEQFQEIRNKYKRIVISIARDDAPKRIDLFLDIAKRIPDYAFVWIGNLKNYEVPQNVFLLGQIPMGYLLLRECDLFVLCSNFEGLPMSIIEALSFSKPVISSKVGGVPEILDGKNGFAVDNNVESFRNAIISVLDNPETLTNCAIYARRTYDEKFTLERMVNEYDQLYKTID